MFEKYADFRNEFVETLEQGCTLATTYGFQRFSDTPKLIGSKLNDRYFNIAVIGHMKRGKSTFINCLLGRDNDDISPIDGPPCTSTIIAYHDKSRHQEGADCAEVQFFDGNDDVRVSTRRIALSEIRDYSTEEKNKRNFKNVSRIDVYSGFPLLQGCVCLVDTPGRGAIHSHHERLLAGFLPRTDAIILVISTGMPIQASERAFLDRLAEEEKKKIFYVLTKVDQAPNEKQFVEAKDWVLNQIREAGLTCVRLYPIAAKQVWATRRGLLGQEEVSPYDEFSVLENDLERFIVEQADNERKLTQTFALGLDTCKEALRVSENAIGEQLALFQKSSADIDLQIEELKAWIDSRRAEATKAKDKFRKKWRGAVERFRSNVEDRAQDLEDRIVSLFAGASLWNLLGVSDRVRRELDKKFNPLLRDAERNLDDQLKSAVEQFYEVADETLVESTRDSDTMIRTKHHTFRAELGMSTKVVAALGLGGSGFAAGGGALIGAQALGLVAAKWIALPGAYTLPALLAALGMGPGSALYAGFVAAAAALPAAMLVMAGGLVAGKLIHMFAQRRSEDELRTEANEAVRKALESFFEKIQEELDKARTSAENDFDSCVEEALEAKKEMLQEARQYRAKADPSRMAKLERDLKNIDVLEEKIAGLELRLNRGIL